MKRILLGAGVALTTLAALPAHSAEARIFRYDSTPNYCPEGLQPVVFGGEISCGVPDQEQTYFEMKVHPPRTRAAQPSTSVGGYWDGSKSPSR